MTRFFKKQKRMDVYTEAIAGIFNKVDKKITPSEVANYLRIHPNTARDRILKLQKQGFIDCKREGRLLICSRRRKFIF